jgi:hypothetical protein
MRRRAFLAGAAAAATIAPVAAQARATSGKGETVTMRGYLRKVTNYYLVLTPTAQKTDPKTTNYANWPTDCVRVYPKDVAKMPGQVGVVSVTGRLWKGNQMDAMSKTVATVVMTDAVLG